MYDIYELEHLGIVLPYEIIEAYASDQTSWVMVPYTPRDPLSHDRYGGHPEPLRALKDYESDGTPIWDFVRWPIAATVSSWKGVAPSEYEWGYGRNVMDWPFWLAQGYTPLANLMEMEPEDAGNDPRPVRVWGGWPLTNDQAHRLMVNSVSTLEFSPWLALEAYDDLCQQYCVDGIDQLRAMARRDPKYKLFTATSMDWVTGEETGSRDYFDDYSHISDLDAAEMQSGVEQMEAELQGLPKDKDGDWVIDHDLFAPQLDDDLAEIWTRLQGVQDRCLKALAELGFEGMQLRREEELSEWY